MISGVSNSAAFNPFATEYTDAVPYQFEVGDWESNLRRLESLNYCAAIVGPKGTGKTTLLEQLVERLEERFGKPNVRHHSMARQQKHRSEIVNDLIEEFLAGKILLLDSIERLSFWQRNRLFRLRNRSRGNNSGSGIVVTSHAPCRLTPWIETRGSFRALSHVVENLNDVPNRDKVLRYAEIALRKHQGNVRDTLRELYDRFAENGFDRGGTKRDGS